MCLCYFPTFQSITVCADLYLLRLESPVSMGTLGQELYLTDPLETYMEQGKGKAEGSTLEKRVKEFWNCN